MSETLNDLLNYLPLALLLSNDKSRYHCTDVSTCLLKCLISAEMMAVMHILQFFNAKGEDMPNAVTFQCSVNKHLV